MTNEELKAYLAALAARRPIGAVERPKDEDLGRFYDEVNRQLGFVLSIEHTTKKDS